MLVIMLVIITVIIVIFVLVLPTKFSGFMLESRRSCLHLASGTNHLDALIIQVISCATVSSFISISF
jgi:hypothetical protein